jgi:hypothetical protein
MSMPLVLGFVHWDSGREGGSFSINDSDPSKEGIYFPQLSAISLSLFVMYGCDGT